MDETQHQHRQLLLSSIYSYLKENGLEDTANSLLQESSFDTVSETDLLEWFSILWQTQSGINTQMNQMFKTGTSSMPPPPKPNLQQLKLQFQQQQNQVLQQQNHAMTSISQNHNEAINDYQLNLLKMENQNKQQKQQFIKQQMQNKPKKKQPNLDLDLNLDKQTQFDQEFDFALNDNQGNTIESDWFSMMGSGPG